MDTINTFTKKTW